MKRLIALIVCLSIASPSWATYTLLAHRGDGTGANGGTSGTIDTTGADLIVCVISGDSSAYLADTLGITDSKSNSWTQLTEKRNAGDGGVAIWYSRPTSVGTGHTFSVTGTATYGTILITAWSGSVATPFDVQNGAASGGAVTTLQPGSVTPNETNELVIAGIVYDQTSGTVSVDSSFTISDQVNQTSFQYYGGALAYKVQTSVVSDNPTWTISSSAASAVIASFKDTPGAATTFTMSIKTNGLER